ncbi:hypothetical protein BV25DRAFT_1831647 [Artomyces pyxidatus]|uniref:Uncharacterized protein n=1 Tax=Artomyces pyxidatus TaxID=48021 RepID=A0ACB8SKP1_9AGAM|nr:hypothetical protein BV25DRAFT_1831647 [Artomyces pyxidatus]
MASPATSDSMTEDTASATLAIALQVMRQVFDHLHVITLRKMQSSEELITGAREVLQTIFGEDAPSGLNLDLSAENEALSTELHGIREIYSEEGWYTHNEVWTSLFQELCALYARTRIHLDNVKALSEGKAPPHPIVGGPLLTAQAAAWKALHADINAALQSTDSETCGDCEALTMEGCGHTLEGTA